MSEKSEFIEHIKGLSEPKRMAFIDEINEITLLLDDAVTRISMLSAYMPESLDKLSDVFVDNPTSAVMQAARLFEESGQLLKDITEQSPQKVLRQE